jgi:hypothetical protein
VLNRDHWTCGLCGRTINPLLKPPHPDSASVHHTQGKALGDDPAYLMAAHRLCNAKVGDPVARNPKPRPLTEW